MLESPPVKMFFEKMTPFPPCPNKPPTYMMYINIIHLQLKGIVEARGAKGSKKENLVSHRGACKIPDKMLIFVNSKYILEN